MADRDTHLRSPDFLDTAKYPQLTFRSRKIEKAGEGAYVVVNATYKFKQKGAAMREPARMTYALRKGPQGWKITGWTWTGPNPTPAP